MIILGVCFLAVIATVLTVAMVRKSSPQESVKPNPQSHAPAEVGTKAPTDDSTDALAEVEEPDPNSAPINPPTTKAASIEPDPERIKSREMPVISPPSAPPSAQSARLPFAQMGESLVRPMPFRRIDGAGEVVPTEPVGVIPWNRAHYYVGKVITVEGKVVITRNTGHVCFLNFDKDWQGKFYVILFQDVLGAWAEPPEKWFMDKVVRVTGEVKLRGTTPQLQVERVDQITIVQ